MHILAPRIKTRGAFLIRSETSHFTSVNLLGAPLQAFFFQVFCFPFEPAQTSMAAPAQHSTADDADDIHAQVRRARMELQRLQRLLPNHGAIVVASDNQSDAPAAQSVRVFVLVGAERVYCVLSCQVQADAEITQMMPSLMLTYDQLARDLRQPAQPALAAHLHAPNPDTTRRAAVQSSIARVA